MNSSGTHQNSRGSQLPRPLRGIIPPLITPLTEGGELDRAALKQLTRHLIEGGVHGLFILGSTGETPSLDSGIKRAVIDVVCEASDGEVPVIVNVSDTCWNESQDLVKHAGLSGACAVALCPPYYFPLDQEELLRYAEQFANSISLPLFVYNIPQFAHTEFAEETVIRLAENQNIAGLKNSNGSVDYLRTVQSQTAHRPEFSLLVGSEEILLDAIEAGAHGGVCGGANMFPRLFVQLYDQAINGNRAKAADLQALVKQMADGFYRIGPQGTAYLRGLKCVLSLLGLSSDKLAPPISTFDRVERAGLQERFETLMPLIGQVQETLN